MRNCLTKPHRQTKRACCRPVVEELEPRLTPSLSYTLNLDNETGLPAPTASNPSAIQILGYTNSNGGMYLNKDGTFQSFPSPLPSSLTSFKLSDLTNGISLTGTLTSARIVVAYGAPFSLTIAGGQVTGPSPNLSPFAGPTGEPYDIVELTLNQEGSNNPGLFINTSQVDQFGMPITVTNSDNSQAVGVAPGVTRSQLIQGFQNYVNGQPGGSTFAQLVIQATQPAPPTPQLPYNNVRIEAPADVTTSPYPWATYLNGTLRQLFEAPPGWSSSMGHSDLIVQSSVLNGSNYVDYEGTPVQWQYAGTSGGITSVKYRSIPTAANPNPTVTTVALPTLESGYSYNYQGSDENSWFNALMFTPITNQPGELEGPYFVFEPFWQANTSVKVTGLTISGTTATLTTNGDSGVVYPGPGGNSTVTIDHSSDPSVLSDGTYTVTNVLSPTQFQIAVSGGTTPASFSADVSLGDSATPSWIAAAHQAALTPGQMVFAGNGVFADQGAGPNTGGQVSAPSATQDTYQLVLANLENQLVAALNRGVATVDYTNQLSPKLSITKVAFGTDSGGNPQAIFTTSQPVTFAPSVGEFVTITGLPSIAHQNLNNFYSPTGVLGWSQFTVALPPGSPTSGSYPVTADTAFAQLVQDSSGDNPGQYLNSTWYWLDPTRYYQSGAKDNLYAQALHNMTVTPTTGGQPVSPFINQQVYALSYDDQGGHSPSLFFGPSDSGDTVTATLDPWGASSPSQTPSPPADVTALAGNAAVTLHWDNVSDATSYNIYRGTSSGGETSPPIATVSEGSSPPSVFTYTDTTVTNGTTYYYIVTAVNSAGESNDSNEAQATPSASGQTTITATAGSGQSTLVNSAFATDLQATVTDASGQPVSGATVVFEVPSSGPGGIFTGGTNTISEVTNSSGVATAPIFTANLLAGSYTVSAFVSGVTSPATFTLTNLSPLGSSPNAIYVENVYALLLGRAADPGAVGWVNALDAGTAPFAVVQGIEGTTEYLHDVVEAVYQHYLNRAADPQALAAWTSALAGGESIEQMTAGILASPEYFNDQPSPGNASFVASLYQNVLGRSASAAEMQAWVNALSGGTSREQVAMAMLTSTEYLTDLVNGGTWVPYVPTTNWGGYYPTFLRRPADPNSLGGWVNALAAGVSDQAVLATIFGSAEGYRDWS